MARDEMRAGDSDRQAVADQLKTALDEGRLDLSEYDERLQKTYGAKTFGDLKGLLKDLPGTVPVQHSQVKPASSPSAPAAQPHPHPHPGFGQVARWTGPYGGVFLVCTAIWLVTSLSAGHLTYFWPVWMLFPIVLGIGAQWRADKAGANPFRAERDARRAERRSRRRGY
jgi:hypothetical protein